MDGTFGCQADSGVAAAVAAIDEYEQTSPPSDRFTSDFAPYAAKA